MIMAQSYSQWLDTVQTYLRDELGIDSGFAGHCATMLAYFFEYSLNPVVTSGYRTAEKQAQLSTAYQRGQAGVVAKPAVDSLHCKTNWLGKPAARAIDISTRNPALAAEIAAALGIGAGFYFRIPDPVHFYDISQPEPGLFTTIAKTIGQSLWEEGKANLELIARVF